MKATFYLEAVNHEGQSLLNANLEIEFNHVLSVGTELSIWDGDPAMIENTVVDLCDNSVAYCCADFIITEEALDELVRSLRERDWNVAQPLEFGEPDA